MTTPTPTPTPAASPSQNSSSSCLTTTTSRFLISIPLLLLSIAVFALGFFIYHTPPPVHPDFRDVVDLMTDSGNLDNSPYLDEALLRSRKIVACTDINPQISKKIIASLILLNAANPQKPIALYLRTEGGWVSDAFAIVDTMRAISAPVNVYALGGTNSAGAIILAAGTGRRVAMPHSIIMIHDNLTQPSNANNPYDIDKVENDLLIDFYRKNTSLPKNWFKDFGDKTHCLNVEQALKFGIIDEISDTF